MPVLNSTKTVVFEGNDVACSYGINTVYDYAFLDLGNKDRIEELEDFDISFRFYSSKSVDLLIDLLKKTKEQIEVWEDLPESERQEVNSDMGEFAMADITHI